MTDIGLADTLHVFAATSVGVLLPTPAGAGPWHFAIVMLLGILGYASYYREVWLWMKQAKSNKY